MREIHKKNKEKAQSKFTPKNIQMYLNANRKSGLKSPRMLNTGSTKRKVPSMNTGSAFDTYSQRNKLPRSPKEGKDAPVGFGQYLSSLFGCGYPE